MIIKEAILCKGEKPHSFVMNHGIDYRGYADNYIEAYTVKQLEYLWKHKLIEEYKKCGALWENPYKEYWQFTEKGKRWRQWYTTPYWSWFKIFVLRTYWWEHKWQTFMIKVFNKHYTWQEYVGMDLSEI